jgi:GT2 family glycosyltransferase
VTTNSPVHLPLSLVVPCYERPTQTRQLLRSLDRSTSRCEIILVDDSSPQPLSWVVSEYPHLNIKYIRNEKNLGPAHSRNIGISHCQYNFVAFTDNDCVADESWLTHLYKAIAESPPQIAGIGGRVAAARNDLFSQYYDYHKILDPWYFRGKYYYLTTANSIFKRHAVDLVGGFDATLLTAGGEDPGLCFKLQNVGYSFGYSPYAIIYHDYRPALAAFMRTFYRYGYGCAVQSTKHFRPQDFVQDKSFGALEGHGD